ncbi:heavy-metal-associated domain-containing protein [Desulfofalx alkaliphila]|uniref:heavy-metal-associated domain-containing protein n=1 Tax=Desulfofalx alkaliphila TaxID=105483 RepID=UPI000AC7A3DB|nr:heavy-metal-associated domain-containing protein [Desulfofalx alkaliphila]
MTNEVYKVGGLFKREDKEEIETYLSQIDGVKKVEADLEDKTVAVSFDPSVVQSDWIRETLQSLGHDTYSIH